MDTYNIYPYQKPFAPWNTQFLLVKCAGSNAVPKRSSGWLGDCHDFREVNCHAKCVAVRYNWRLRVAKKQYRPGTWCMEWMPTYLLYLPVRLVIGLRPLRTVADTVKTRHWRRPFDDTRIAALCPAHRWFRPLDLDRLSGFYGLIVADCNKIKWMTVNFLMFWCFGPIITGLFKISNNKGFLIKQPMRRRTGDYPEMKTS